MPSERPLIVSEGNWLDDADRMLMSKQVTFANPGSISGFDAGQTWRVSVRSWASADYPDFQTGALSPRPGS